MKRIVTLTTTCDGHYLELVGVALHTLYRNGGHWPICLQMINGNIDHERMCRRINPDITNTVHVSHPGCDSLWVLERRLRIGKHLLDEGHDQILCLDSDIIVRKSLEGIWDGVDPSTLKVWFKGGDRKPRTRFQGAVYLLGNSAACRAMYGEVIEMLAGSKRWFDCQEQLYLVWHRHKTEVPRVDLPTIYNDNFLMPDSAIWHVKHGHENECAWRVEWLKWKAEVDARLSAIPTE